jgi:hypothetical protein
MIASHRGFNLSSFDLNQQKVAAWTELTTKQQNQADISLETKVRGVHTTRDNYEIFSSDLQTMAKILSQGKNSRMSNHLPAIPQPNQGLIYLDWRQNQEMLERQLPMIKFLELLGKPLFDNLRSLTLSSYRNEPGLVKGGIFVQFD